MSGGQRKSGWTWEVFAEDTAYLLRRVLLQLKAIAGDTVLHAQFAEC